LFIFICGIMLFPVAIKNAYCGFNPVLIEFLYYEPCSVCPGAEKYYEVYLHNSKVVTDIQRDYGEKVVVERIFFFSDIGLEKVEEYNLSLGDWNTIVVNHEVVLVGGDKFVNETYLRQTIDSYLEEQRTYIHDIAVLTVEASSYNVFVGDTVEVSVAVKNEGNYSEAESFSVKVFINESLFVESNILTLEPNKTLEVNFTLNFSNIAPGRYILKVLAGPVENEVDIKDNKREFEIEVGKITSYLPDKPSIDASIIGPLTTVFILGFFETFSPCLIILLSFIVGYTLSGEVKFKEGFAKIMVFGAGFVSASAILGLACGLLFFSMPHLQVSLTLAVCFFAIIFSLNLLGLLKFPFQTKLLVSKIAKKYVFTYIGLFILGFIFYFLDPCIAPIFASMASFLFSEFFFFTLLVFSIGAFVPFVLIGLFVGAISKITRWAYKHRVFLRGLSGIILLGYALYLLLSIILH